MTLTVGRILVLLDCENIIGFNGSLIFLKTSKKGEKALQEVTKSTAAIMSLTRVVIVLNIMKHPLAASISTGLRDNSGNERQRHAKHPV